MPSISLYLPNIDPKTELTNAFIGMPAAAEYCTCSSTKGRTFALIASGCHLAGIVAKPVAGVAAAVFLIIGSPVYMTATACLLNKHRIDAVIGGYWLTIAKLLGTAAISPVTQTVLCARAIVGAIFHPAAYFKAIPGINGGGGGGGAGGGLGLVQVPVDPRDDDVVPPDNVVPPDENHENELDNMRNILQRAQNLGRERVAVLGGDDRGDIGLQLHRDLENDLRAILNRHGIEGLLNRINRLDVDDLRNRFNQTRLDATIRNPNVTQSRNQTQNVNRISQENPDVDDPNGSKPTWVSYLESEATRLQNLGLLTSNQADAAKNYFVKSWNGTGRVTAPYQLAVMKKHFEEMIVVLKEKVTKDDIEVPVIPDDRRAAAFIEFADASNHCDTRWIEECMRQSQYLNVPKDPIKRVAYYIKLHKDEIVRNLVRDNVNAHVNEVNIYRRLIPALLDDVDGQLAQLEGYSRVDVNQAYENGIQRSYYEKFLNVYTSEGLGKYMDDVINGFYEGAAEWRRQLIFNVFLKEEWDKIEDEDFEVENRMQMDLVAKSGLVQLKRNERNEITNDFMKDCFLSDYAILQLMQKELDLLQSSKMLIENLPRRQNDQAIERQEIEQLIRQFQN